MRRFLLPAVDFADPGLAAGFLLAAIPLILYLLERRRTPAVDWPAMRFFLPHLKRTARWMQVRELALIALRSLIIACLVAALMRPGHGDPEGGPEGKAERTAGVRGVVIILDNSYSMAYRAGPSGQTSWDAARAAALRTIDRLGPGDLAQVVTLAAVPAPRLPRPTGNREDLRGSVETAALAGGSSSIAAGLDLAAELAASLPSGAREVLLITDLQENGWALLDRGRWEWIRARFSSLKPAPRLQMVDVGCDDPVNRAVLEVEVPRPVAGTDRSVEIVARLGQFGDPRPHAVAVGLSVEGEGREMRSVEVKEGPAAEVRFRHHFTAAGPHRVEVRLEPDSLEADDVRYLALEVVDSLPVLIVAGALAKAAVPSPGGDGELLDLALCPRSRAGPVREVLFRPEVVDRDAFGGLSPRDLERYRVVVLSDVPAMEPRSAAFLEDYVRGGGGVIILLGEKLSAPAYNQDLFRGGRGMLPARLLALEGGSLGGEGLASPAKFLEGHPALAELAGALPELGKVRVRRWWKTEPAPDAAVVAELKAGVPYLVEKPFGRGRAILVVTSATLDSSDLPRRPVFVPFLHGLAYRAAASPRDHLNVLLGGALMEPLSAQERVGGAEVIDPAGQVLPPALTYRPTVLPGFYTWKRPSPTGERSVLFAANIDPRESDLRRPAREALEQVTGPLGITVARSVEEGGAAGEVAPTRTRWWRAILALGVALAVLEVFLTRALTRGRAPWRSPAV